MFESLRSTLKLECPIVFLDLETTGTDVANDRIVELAYLEIRPHAVGELGFLKEEYKINPGVPIPVSSTAIHGITDADVANCPTFQYISAEIHDVLKGNVLCGHNINGFDIPMLANEFERAGSVMPPYDCSVDTYEIFRSYFNHSLEAAHRVYLGFEMEGNHRALADVYATANVFERMITLHKLNPNPSILGATPIDPTWIDRGGKFRWKDGEAVFTFGKVAGRSLRDVTKKDEGFLRWMLGKDFSDEVKDIVCDALKGNFHDKV